MNDYINYYDLLGIKKDASIEEIKKAYRENAKKWHPDLNKDPKAPEMAKKINEAKEVLLDDEKRRDYDMYLNNYKSNIYDNFDKNDTGSTNNYYHNNYEEKTYTKWEYFILYLKYYKTNIFRKILGTILVLIESLFCAILQIINYALAFAISYLGYYLYYACIISSGLLILLISADFVFNIANYSIKDYVLMGLGAMTFIVFSIILPILPDIFANKIPILISKLNMYLFKFSIGYKK